MQEGFNRERREFLKNGLGLAGALLFALGAPDDANCFSRFSATPAWIVCAQTTAQNELSLENFVPFQVLNEWGNAIAVGSNKNSMETYEKDMLVAVGTNNDIKLFRQNEHGQLEYRFTIGKKRAYREESIYENEYNLRDRPGLCFVNCRRGMLDIVCYDDRTGKLNYFFGNGDGTFSDGKEISGPRYQCSITEYDDETTMIVTKQRENDMNDVFFWLVDGKMNFLERKRIRNLSGSVIGCADVNGDGKKELITLNGMISRKPTMRIYHVDNDYNLIEIDDNCGRTKHIGLGYGLCFHDNGSGYSDILVTHPDDRVIWLHKNRKGYFQPGRKIEIPGNPKDIKIFHNERDGHDYIIVGCHKQVLIYRSKMPAFVRK